MFSLALARGETLLVINNITEALARAHSGDTLLVVGPKVFAEHLMITKSIRLLGTNAPVLDGGKIGTPLTIVATNVEIRGLTIRNSGADLTAFDAGVMILTNHATVADCRVENEAFGVYLRGASNCRRRRKSMQRLISTRCEQSLFLGWEVRNENSSATCC
jgi:nitrous oxidase accessory protein